MVHRIADVYFAPARSGLPSWVSCSCGWQGEWSSHEAVAEGYLTHRREVGLPGHPSSHPRGDGQPKADGTFWSGLGTSKLPPAERGRLGAAAKRAKKQA